MSNADPARPDPRDQPPGYGPSPADPDPFSNPLSRKTPLGGRTGVAIVSIAPFVALILFFIAGFAGGWNWSWLFFLLVPITAVVVYGFGGQQRR